MRVVIVFDMEGTSHIGHPREIAPIYPEYWDAGRAKLTADIAAAARGLLDGGAAEVVVMNHHGAGEVEWPNVVVDDLPDGVRPIEWDKLAMRDQVDAMFHVGAHARAGSPSFFSHTILPGLRLRVGDELLSESHWWAWTGDVPVLGIVGSKALGEGLGSLSDIPFLAVQQSDDRASARPVFHTERQTAEAIQSFAHSAIRDSARQRARAPKDLVLEASVQNGDDAADTMREAGWTRTSRTEFRIEAGGWRDDGDRIETAIEAAAGAAWQPYDFTLSGIDPSSRATGLAFPGDRLAATTAWLTAYANERLADWITPEQAARWEGLDIGLARED